MEYVEFQLKFNTEFRLRMSKKDIKILGEIEREYIESNIKLEPISDELDMRIFDLWSKYLTQEERLNFILNIDFSKF